MAEIALAGATSVLRQTVGVLGNLILDEDSRLSRLRDSILWIESEMRYIQSYLEDVDAKQGQNRKITCLVIDIRDLAYDMEDIMDTYFPGITSHRKKGIFSRLKSAFCILRYTDTVHNFVAEVEGIKRRVENINRLRLTYGINEGSRRDGIDVWDPRRTFAHVDEPYVVGFDKHIKELVTKFHYGDSRFYVISIVGMPGLGKTTLARKILKDVINPVASDSDNPHFEFSAWVYVSQQPNIKEVLLDIARQMQLKILPKKDEKDSDSSKQNREEAIEVKLEDIEMQLFTFLSQKRYVIVLDDIWNTETWDAFKNAIPTNSKNGSRIIVTSRHTFVGIHVGGRNSLHELQPLDQKTSEELFLKMLISNTTEMLDPELQNIGQQILKRCGGVPLAIVITVGLLLVRDRTEHAWKGVLESMGQGQDQCLEIFSLSYKDLPTQLKPCFLYFGLFPEDHEIKVFELINLWVAEGFVKPIGTREVEDVGEDFLNHLIARNLIQVVRRRFDGRIRTCRIHDILHDLCIRVSEEINFFKRHDNETTGNSATRVRRVTAHKSSVFEDISSNSQHVNLRTMLYFNGEEERVEISQDLRLLRVLRLDKITLSRPNDIGNLCRLTYLQLGSVPFLILPSSICNLKSLLTLDVQSRSSFYIPIGIWKMRQLRHLILSCFENANFRGIDVTLPNLQSLRLKPVIYAGYVASLRLNNLTSLRKLAILSWSTRQPKPSYALNLPRCENLHKLSLGVRMEKLPDHDELPPNVTKLRLTFSELVESPLETLKKLPKLKILKLGKKSYEGRQIICSGGPDNFPQLETLEIHDLPRLEELIAEEGAMPRLKKFSIVKCIGLTVIPDRFRNITTTTSG